MKITNLLAKKSSKHWVRGGVSRVERDTAKYFSPQGERFIARHVFCCPWAFWPFPGLLYHFLSVSRPFDAEDETERRLLESVVKCPIRHRAPKDGRLIEPYLQKQLA